MGVLTALVVGAGIDLRHPPPESRIDMRLILGRLGGASRRHQLPLSVWNESRTEMYMAEEAPEPCQVRLALLRFRIYCLRWPTRSPRQGLAPVDIWLR